MTYAPTPTLSGSRASLDFPRLLAVALVAAVANLISYALGSMAGATWTTSAPEAIDPITIAVFTVAPLLLAGVVVRFASRRRPGVVNAAAWAGLAFGFLGTPMPFLASSDVVTAVSLASMHVIAGIAWFVALKPGLFGRR